MAVYLGNEGEETPIKYAKALELCEGLRKGADLMYSEETPMKYANLQSFLLHNVLLINRGF
jgi:hypothetical protein